MQRAIKYSLTAIAYCLITTNSSAQDFINDFKKINAKYQDSSYQMKLTYNYYNELNSTKPEEVQKAEVRKEGNQYYVKLHQMETIISNGVFLQANHDLKALILDSAKPAYYKSLNIQLDSLAKFYKGVEFSLEDSLTAIYKIPSQGQGIAYTLVKFNIQTFEIKQIIIQFLDARKNAQKGALRNKLVIQYDEVNFDPQFTAQSFSHQKYLYKKNNRYQVKSAYQKYRLVSNLK